MLARRRQRQGVLKLYKFKSIEDLDAHLIELRHKVHSLIYAKAEYKGDADILLDARLALMKERQS